MWYGQLCAQNRTPQGLLLETTAARKAPPRGCIWMHHTLQGWHTYSGESATAQLPPESGSTQKCPPLSWPACSYHPTFHSQVPQMLQSYLPVWWQTAEVSGVPAKLAGPVLLLWATPWFSWCSEAYESHIESRDYIMLLTPLRAWTMEINFASMKKTNVCNITCALPGPGPSWNSTGRLTRLNGLHRARNLASTVARSANAEWQKSDIMYFIQWRVLSCNQFVFLWLSNAKTGKTVRTCWNPSSAPYFLWNPDVVPHFGSQALSASTTETCEPSTQQLGLASSNDVLRVYTGPMSTQTATTQFGHAMIQDQLFTTVWL